MSSMDDGEFLTETIPLLEKVADILRDEDPNKILFIGMCLLKSYMDESPNKDDAIEEIVKHLRES